LRIEQTNENNDASDAADASDLLRDADIGYRWARSTKSLLGMREDFPDVELTESIISAFHASYNTLGFCFLESVYPNALDIELEKRGVHVQREVRADVLYDGKRIGSYRIDKLVERRIVLELKATEALPPFARRQLLNGLRASRLQIGLLLHYGPNP